ncbi:FAD/NAD(P)-binding domain-containing protein [Stipitochalara longipes BDJ]|nr:FAD/NAD(P)-binding domain-containing protein [Stipitochalara longipes BDJ]
MAAQPQNVIIVGGSLAGLFSGLILKHLGHNVQIFERSPSALLQSQGAGIVVGQPAKEYFAKHIKVNHPLLITSYMRQTLDRSGFPIHQNYLQQNMVSWDLLYFAMRACFDGLESTYCEVPPKNPRDGNAKYIYSRKVTNVMKRNDGLLQVEFEDTEGRHGVEVADMVLAADGPSSTIRKLLMPEVERKYAGYVAWRGTLLESKATQELKEMFVHNFTFFHGPGIQIVAYLIPGKDGSLDPDSRLINWVWYCNYDRNSQEYKDLMTDIDGHLHHFTLPIGKMKPNLWAQQKKHATNVLAPQFAKLVNETEQAFVQAITDVMSARVAFFDDKLLLIGDAIAGFRPHTVASTNQAAYDSLLLEKMLKGEMTKEQMQYEMMRYARQVAEIGVQMGNRSQIESLKGPIQPDTMAL